MGYRFITIFFFCLQFIEAQKNCSFDKKVFSNKEYLSFDVYYHWGLIWAHAGECMFSVRPEEYGGKNTLHFVGDGKTFKNYDWFFKVRDKFESWTDTATLEPYRYIRNSSEGGTKTYNDNYFDHKKKTIVCFKMIKTEVKKDTMKYTDCTFDVLTMIYFARCIDYTKIKANDKIPISLYLDGKVHDSLYIRYKGKEKIKTKLGEKNCIVFSPLLIKGTIFAGGEDMTVWVSDDEKKIPLLIKSSIVVGEIQVKIRDIK